MKPSGGRIEALDALRGFAIFGILLINIQLFSGYGFIPLDDRGALPWAGWDEQLRTLLSVFVRGKFYTLFSLLFGYSFVMLARKSGGDAVRVHLRRMAGLLVIGLAHSVLLWPWDILLLYALIGLLLVPFLHRSPAALLAWSAGLLVTVGVLNGLGPALGLPDGRGKLATRMLLEHAPAFGDGGYADVVRANFYLTGSIFIEWAQDLRLLRVWAMFLLGAAAAALRLAEPDSGRRGLLIGAALLGLAGGLPLEAAETLLDGESSQHFVHTAADTFGAPLLALGYAAALILWWNAGGPAGSGLRAALAPVGRMALTNYLLQSAICVPLFYRFGGGLFAQFSLGALLLFVCALFTAQIAASALWLRYFTQGPMEWLWRWQIKGRRPAWLRRDSSS